MNSDTQFCNPLSFTTSDLSEASKVLDHNKVEELPTFTESISHQFDPDRNQFQVKVDGEPLNFTKPAYLEFCSSIGIPGNFAERIPNDLLIQCVDEMLGSNNQKVRFLVRNKNVISGCKKDSFILVKPTEFLETANKLTDSHLFREANISDEGTSLLFEPLSNSTIVPNTGKVDDRFNVGISFGFGFESGLVEAFPYSLRHCCINVAITRSNYPKYKLVEKINRKKNGSVEFYNRLLENYTSDIYSSYMKEINERIGTVVGKKVTDIIYDHTYKNLNRMLGSEVAWSIIGIDEERHDEIMTDIKYKKQKNEWSEQNQTELEDLDIFDLFDQITSAAKGYNGSDRTRLQLIGGRLI